MKMFEPFDTTADVGLKIFGKNLTEIFENASLGMFSLILEPFTPEDYITKELEYQSENNEEILFSLLSDLVYLLDVEGFVLHKISTKELGKFYFKFALVGEKYSKSKHSFLMQIKAVTYHNLEIKKVGEYYQTDIVFDV
jgi:SHS2 domain-containing protein